MKRVIYAFLVAIIACAPLAAVDSLPEVDSSISIDYDLSGLVVQNSAAPEGKADTLVVYSAEAWCVPCRIISPTLKALKREGYKVVLYDIDEIKSGEQENKHKLTYTAVPTLYWLKDGKAVRVHTGVISRDEILQTLWKPDGPPAPKLLDRLLPSRPFLHSRDLGRSPQDSSN